MINPFRYHFNFKIQQQQTYCVYLKNCNEIIPLYDFMREYILIDDNHKN